MKNLILLASAFALTIAGTSCNKTRIKGEGTTITDSRNVATFSSITANGSTNITVYPSDNDRVVVTGYENLVPVYETKVVDGRLTLEFRKDYINVRNSNITVAIYSTAAHRVTLNGSGNVSIQPDQHSEYMNLTINGSGEMRIADNHFKGMNCDINGSGDINGIACHTDTLDATISGSGNIKMNVANLLNVKISGSGNVDYWGNPVVGSLNVSGSGKVNKH